MPEAKKKPVAKKEAPTAAKKDTAKKPAAAKKAVVEEAVKKPVAKVAPKKEAPKKAPAAKEVAKKAAPKPEAKKAATVVSKKKTKKAITFSLGGKKYVAAVGKRKTAVARIRLYEGGSGKVEVNGRPIKEYFFGILTQNALEPLRVTDHLKTYDITAKIVGGGVSAHADALRHGIAKALIELDAALRPVLKKAGFLTRDSRVKERKKPGLKRARRAPQWRKR